MTQRIVSILAFAAVLAILPNSAVSFSCDGFLGVIADPEDCQAFYECDYLAAYQFFCSPGYLFDNQLLVCNYEYDVDCGDRPYPNATTTTPSTPVTSSTSTTATAMTTTSSQEDLSTTTSDGISFRHILKIIDVR